MARGTKLYQQATSPLIEGHSRTRRPSWQPWLVGSILGAVATLAGFAILQLVAYEFGALADTDFLPLTLLAAAPYIAAASALGSAGGVWLAGRMGWRRRWLAAMVAGLAAGVLFLIGDYLLMTVLYPA